MQVHLELYDECSIVDFGSDGDRPPYEGQHRTNQGKHGKNGGVLESDSAGNKYLFDNTITRDAET